GELYRGSAHAAVEAGPRVSGAVDPGAVTNATVLGESEHRRMDLLSDRNADRGVTGHILPVVRSVDEADLGREQPPYAQVAFQQLRGGEPCRDTVLTHQRVAGEGDQAGRGPDRERPRTLVNKGIHHRLMTRGTVREMDTYGVGQ